jgi:aspartate aminotransferase
MINIKKSGARYSAIVGIGEKLRKQSADEGRAYLMLNRGINAVVNINIESLIPNIDFNSADIQVYPPVKGWLKLRQAINQNFFFDNASTDNIFITNGGTNTLDLIFKTIDTNNVFLPSVYWGSYLNILKINKLNIDLYPDLSFLMVNAYRMADCVVVICDPNNPSGSKYVDIELLNTIEILNKAGALVILDCPYRRLFTDWEKDYFYKKLLAFENVIICESFSKSIGLSGQRIGFVHSVNNDFMNELAINLLYATNGVNTFAQILVEAILTTESGKKAAIEFRKKTADEIKKNIDFLYRNNLIANEFYDNTLIWGIFVIINKSFDELLQFQIGSVSMKYFSQMPEQEANKYSRICVSVSNEKFESFFNKMLE